MADVDDRKKNEKWKIRKYECVKTIAKWRKTEY